MSDFDSNRFTRVNRHPFRTWDHPGGVPVRKARFLRDDDEVLELQVDGQVRAYPVGLIAAHHIVADTLGGREVLVTY